LIKIAHKRYYRFFCNYISILAPGGGAMQKSLVILTGALFFGTLATSAADPLDSPDTVYIDGQPCNRPCQSYMAWSHQVVPGPAQLQRVPPRGAARHQPPNAIAGRAIGIGEGASKRTAQGRVTKQAALTSIEMPLAGAVNLQLMGGPAASGSTGARTSETRPVTPTVKVSDALSTVGVAADRTRTTQQQVTAATAVAERMSAVAEVAIVIARMEIKSVSDLAGKNIAIDDPQPASSGDVRTAIAAAGAAAVQLDESQTKAIDRVIGGEVPAAVVTLVSREAAEGFPEIAGFRIFRIPLTPEMPQARVENARPTEAVAAATRDRTTQELVTAATALAERMTIPKGDSQRAALTPSNDTDPRIAVLMARPEIKLMSDLTGKEIALDDKLSASSRDVRIAIAAAGAAKVQVNEGQGKALDRVIDGTVPAAVLTLVSREAADAFPEIAGFKIFRIPLTPEMAPAKVADLQLARDALPKTIQERVAAATATAERITAAKVDPGGAELNTSSINRSARSETMLPGAAEKVVPAPSSDDAARIAIVMARPEIKSISDLAGRSIAISHSQSVSSATIRGAIAAAGAADVQVNEGQTEVVNRLILAELPAAVLTLVSPEAAEGFPEITGFRIFRIPLSPGSILVRAPLKTPEKIAAADGEAREPKQAAEKEAAELRQSLQQERDRAARLEHDLALARRANDALASAERETVGKVAQDKQLDAQATKLAATNHDAVAVTADGPRANSEDAADVARLMARANALLAQGNISAARTVLERAAEAGSVQASFTLAETYDPLILPKWGVYGTRADATKARELYAKAEAGGLREAKARFEALASVAR
jgi:TRAP-type uncharacterized transport system substrate-binding protein